MNYKIIDNINDYIDNIFDLDSMFFDKKYLWAKEYQRKLYERNKDSFIGVSLDNKLVGYINYLCITEDKYNMIKTSNITIDDFDINDIIPYRYGNNYITVNSVVIKKEYQDSDVIKLLLDGFCNKIKELEDNNTHISGINGIAISDDGKKVFKYLGFINSRTLDDGNTLYYIEDDIYNTIYNSLNILKNK